MITKQGYVIITENDCFVKQRCPKSYSFYEEPDHYCIIEDKKQAKKEIKWLEKRSPLENLKVAQITTQITEIDE